jgi:hypothetical protein
VSPAGIDSGISKANSLATTVTTFGFAPCVVASTADVIPRSGTMASSDNLAYNKL